MNKNNLNKTIGIIGGMGPQASAKLLEVLIDKCSKDFGVKNDEDFPEIILNSVPVPDFISDEENLRTAFKILKNRIELLEKFNPLCFGIVCNTAHLLLKDLQANTNIPFVSIIDEVTKKVAKANIKKVGLLASPTTIKSGLYQDKLSETNIEFVIPSKTQVFIVENVIRNVLAGKLNETDRQKLISVAQSLTQRGAKGIILGCTELPLIFPKDFSLLIFDSIEILARALLQKFYENRNKNDIMKDMIEPRTLKGFRDFLPKEAKKRAFVLDILKKVFESYGFEPLETPVLEYEDILLGKYGDEGDKLMYRFEDNGGRKVAMRYDQTVPLARVVAQYANDLSLPFKRYQIQNVYRADNTQKGRYREFLQVDIDTVGSSSLLSDAEIIAIAVKGYEALGFKNFKVKINDRSVFSNLFSDEEGNVIARALDKIEKVGQEKVLEELSANMGMKAANVVLQKINNQKKTESYFKVISCLEGFGINEDYFEFEPKLARGLDYYTGLIFEVISDNYPAGSLGGGGRYDELIGMFSNQNIPAVGFSFGFDRIIEAMEELNLFPEDLGGTKVLVTNTSENSSEVARQLRQKRISTELFVDEKPLDKQLRYADKRKIPYILIVSNDKLELKNMTTGEQKEVKLEDVILEWQRPR